jgi:hypothetical protein
MSSRLDQCFGAFAAIFGRSRTELLIMTATTACEERPRTLLGIAEGATRDLQ